MQSRADVVVVGGGATGTGIARDLSMRGADVVLVEKGSLADGTSGRMHGLLHSGARYAIADPESARQCISENRILREIAAHCVEETGGLFVQLSGDSDAYFERKRAACEDVGIPTETISGETARSEEPLLADTVERALRVPDAAVDPFRLVAANAASAENHGAAIRTHTTVTDLLREEGSVVGVAVRGTDGRNETIRADHVVNAAGPWAGEVADMAGIDVPMRPTTGAMVVTNVRQVDTVLNRCRPKTSGDIIVPHETTAILGTTDREVAGPEAFDESQEDVAFLVDELATMVPELRDARQIRAYWGIRPLYDPGDDPDSSTDPDVPTDITRDFTVLDHDVRDDLAGFTTVVGGKVTTYRLMAERVADRVAAHIGIDAECRTAEEPLPGSRGDVDFRAIMRRFGLRSPVAKRTTDRLGDRTQGVLDSGADTDRQVLCECEGVTRAEVRDAIDAVGDDVQAIRQRTRASMGTCQGTMCAHRIAGAIATAEGPESALTALADLTEERWRGQRYVAAGDHLDQLALFYAVHGGTFNRTRGPAAFRAIDAGSFAGGESDDS